MLVIRQEQIEVLRDYMLKQFKDRMVAHLRRYFPEQSKSLSNEDLCETVQYGIEQAAAYEIVNEYDVIGYINLMFTFGHDFDKNPSLPWSSRILNDNALYGSGRRKMDALYKEGEKHLSKVSGMENHDREREP